MELLEVVYEGGEVIDRALAAQRALLASELRTRLTTVDLRRLNTTDRTKVLRDLAKRNEVVKHVLVRGLSGAHEAASFFTRCHLFLDALGRSERPVDRELSVLAFRTKRVFVYSFDMDQAIRGAGIGLVSRHAGPFFPRVDVPAPGDEDFFTVGVLNLGGGTLEVLGKLKKLRVEKELPIDIVSTERVSGVEHVGSAFEVAERADLLLSPAAGEDRWGPDEGAILALCTGRALCTAPSSAFQNLPYSSGKYVPAEKYTPGSYANAALLYPEQRKALDAWPRTPALDWDTVPREILRRL